MRGTQVINEQPGALFDGTCFSGLSGIAGSCFSIFMANVQSQGKWQTAANYKLLVDYLTAGPPALVPGLPSCLSLESVKKWHK